MSSTTPTGIEVIASNKQRGVGFLVLDDRRVTAKDYFQKINRKIERHFRSRFDAWVDGIKKPEWFHGWNASEFRGGYLRCFVFKCKENRSHHRFYGFLCNPDPLNKGFQVCILVNYAKKNQHETDVSFLEDVEEIRMLFINDDSLRKVCKSINDFLGVK